MNAQPIEATPRVFRSRESGSRFPTRYAITKAAAVPAPRRRRDPSLLRPGSAMLTHRLPYPSREDQQCPEPDDPCDRPLRNRTDPSELRAAAVLPCTDVQQESDDRVDLLIRERLLAEHRHRSRAGTHRFGDLGRRRVLKTRDLD